MSRWRLVIGLAVLVVIGVVITFVVVTRPPGGDGTSPGSASGPVLVAMGDSYISGEGADSFYAGTNARHSNECRRAPTAYAARIATSQSYHLIFSACSGARMHNIIPETKEDERGQYPDSPVDIIGGQPQIDVLKAHADAAVVLLSIGGNDVEFAKTVEQCILPLSCLGNAQTYVDRIDAIASKLRDTYAAVRAAAPDAQIFVIGYPMPLGGRECPHNHLGHDEYQFVGDFVHRLDDVISFEAANAGIRYVNVEDAFAGHALCDPAPSGEQAMNALRIQRPEHAIKPGSDWAHDSYHPTAYGHLLLMRRVVAAMASGPDQPQETLPPGVPPPPYVPPENGPPLGPYPFPAGTACAGDHLDFTRSQNVPASSGDGPYFVNDARPGSTICWQSYKSQWRSGTASASGAFSVPISFGRRHGLGSTHVVLYEDASGAWTRVVIRRE